MESDTLTKICNKCGRLLPLEAFAKNKQGKLGRHSQCRECKNDIQRKFYTPEKGRERYLRNYESIREYRQTDKWKALHAEQSRRYRKLYPEKVNAHAQSSYTYEGIGICALCGDAAHHKHHFDYSKPKEIVWLCRLCHAAIHKADKL